MGGNEEEKEDDELPTSEGERLHRHINKMEAKGEGKGWDASALLQPRKRKMATSHPGESETLHQGQGLKKGGTEMKKGGRFTHLRDRGEGERGKRGRGLFSPPSTTFRKRGPSRLLGASRWEKKKNTREEKRPADVSSSASPKGGKKKKRRGNTFSRIYALWKKVAIRPAAEKGRAGRKGMVELGPTLPSEKKEGKKRKELSSHVPLSRKRNEPLGALETEGKKKGREEEKRKGTSLSCTSRTISRRLGKPGRDTGKKAIELWCLPRKKFVANFLGKEPEKRGVGKRRRAWASAHRSTRKKKGKKGGAPETGDPPRSEKKQRG